MTGPTLVLIVGNGAAWEPAALRLLADHPRIVVLRRCVDVDDLLAAATAGQAHVALVSAGAPGFDRPAVDLLRRHGVRPVAVLADAGAAEAGRAAAARAGVRSCVAAEDLADLPDVVLAPDPEPAGPGPAGAPATRSGGVDPADPADPVRPADSGALDPGPAGSGEPAPARGRAVVVWGPGGAPGRTTVATALAAALACRPRRTVLVDADPYGGTVAQRLGVLDEVSGLLAAARLAAAGELDERVASVQRGLDPHLSVVTGLPRPDRYLEVRAGTLELLVEALRREADVVVDTGFSLEEEPVPEYAARPGRNHLTLAALRAADEVVVVGAADPVGLSRLARGLVELRDGVGRRRLHVVVNRMRPSLGWSEREVRGMIEGFARPVGVHFLPEDQATLDRALVAGRTVVEVGESSPLARAVAGLAAAVVPGPGLLAGDGPGDRAPRSGRRGSAVRRRTAGRAHRR